MGTNRCLWCAANCMRALSHMLTASKTPAIPDGSHFFRLLGCRPLANQQQHWVLVIFKYAWLPAVLFFPHDSPPLPTSRACGACWSSSARRRGGEEAADNVAWSSERPGRCGGRMRRDWCVVSEIICSCAPEAPSDWTRHTSEGLTAWQGNAVTSH